MNDEDIRKAVNALRREKEEVGFVYPNICTPDVYLDYTLDYVAKVAQRAMKFQEMNKRDMVNYCGNYLKGKI